MDRKKIRKVIQFFKVVITLSMEISNWQCHSDVVPDNLCLYVYCDDDDDDDGDDDDDDDDDDGF